MVLSKRGIGPSGFLASSPPSTGGEGLEASRARLLSLVWPAGLALPWYLRKCGFHRTVRPSGALS